MAQVMEVLCWYVVVFTAFPFKIINVSATKKHLRTYRVIRVILPSRNRSNKANSAASPEMLG